MISVTSSRFHRTFHALGKTFLFAFFFSGEGGLSVCLSLCSYTSLVDLHGLNREGFINNNKKEQSKDIDFGGDGLADWSI